MMDRLLAPHTPEALAHSHLTENWFNWDLDHPSLDETLIAGCASYQAFSSYLTGENLYLVPRTRSDLERLLRRYSYDNIHNIIAKAPSHRQLESGGYTRICHLAEKSIRDVLDVNDNATDLLAMHARPTMDRAHVRRRDESPGRYIKIK